MQGSDYYLVASQDFSSLSYINLYQNEGVGQDGLHSPFQLGHFVIPGQSRREQEFHVDVVGSWRNVPS